eukprot:2021044-Rhodomonas_salina.1
MSRARPGRRRHCGRPGPAGRTVRTNFTDTVTASGWVPSESDSLSRAPSRSSQAGRHGGRVNPTSGMLVVVEL